MEISDEQVDYAANFPRPKKFCGSITIHFHEGMAGSIDARILKKIDKLCQSKIIRNT